MLRILPLFAMMMIPPAPPPGPGGPPLQRIVTFEASAVQCAAGTEIPVRSGAPDPFSRVIADPAHGTGPINYAPVTVHFRIDATGRPLGISADSYRDPDMWIDSDAAAPALAAWRFKAGAERNDCSVRFTPVAQLAQAMPKPALVRYLATPEGSATVFQPGTVADTAYKAIAPANSTCIDAPRVGVRAWTYVDDYKVDDEPGSFSYAFVSYDVSPSGWAVNPRVTLSTGNRSLEREAVKAMQRSRFVGPARKGCGYLYVHAPRHPIEAPASPDVAAFNPDRDHCPRDKPGWASMPLTYPEPFQRRGIEGWAVVRYDVAPWGSVGNVQVLAAEPAKQFGDQAQQMVSQAQRPASPQGYSGCVDKVVFAMTPKETRTASLGN